MLQRLSAPDDGATNRAADSGSESCSTAGSGTEWFSAAARTLLGKDAGLHLHYITGYPERSCYYYAKGDRQPPADFLYQLFRSEQGEPFFLAFMAGCNSGWWTSLQKE